MIDLIIKIFDFDKRHTSQKRKKHSMYNSQRCLHTIKL